MTLVTSEELTTKAFENDYAIGAFSVASSEMINGVIQAAEKLNSPIILQIAEVRLKQTPLHIIGPAMVEAAKEATVPVAVHLDHGLTENTIKKAIDLGFTSIMFDGSMLPLEENISKSKHISKLARDANCSFEAELGKVGGSEDGTENIEAQLTSIEEAEHFLREVDVDLLAVAIGNAHGFYKGTPEIHFNHLMKLQKSLTHPFVLHGGSGLSEQDFHIAISHGIAKINVATSTFHAALNTVQEKWPMRDYYDLHNALIQGSFTNVIKHIQMFKSAGRAYTNV
jgi:fructose-bisphosphate aldolase, class II